jgi:hypothetical protein
MPLKSSDLRGSTRSLTVAKTLSSIHLETPEPIADPTPIGSQLTGDRSLRRSVGREQHHPSASVQASFPSLMPDDRF